MKVENSEVIRLLGWDLRQALLEMTAGKSSIVEVSDDRIAARRVGDVAARVTILGRRSLHTSNISLRRRVELELIMAARCFAHDTDASYWVGTVFHDNDWIDFSADIDLGDVLVFKKDILLAHDEPKAQLP